MLASSFKLQFFQSSNRRWKKNEVMEEISGQNSNLGLKNLENWKQKLRLKIW